MFIIIIILDSKGQLFEQSLASVQENCILRHSRFAECFVNTICREKFHESIQRRLEKHYSSYNNSLRKRSGGPWVDV